MELAILLSVITTFGHYVVSWAIYLEKVFEMVRVFSSCVDSKMALSSGTLWDARQNLVLLNK